MNLGFSRLFIYILRVWHNSATRIQKSKADADDKREEVSCASCEPLEEMLSHDGNMFECD